METRASVNIIRYLFGKRNIKGKWVYLLASLPFLLFALVGIEYGAFLLYFLPALLCVIQYIHPNIFLWASFLGIFTCGSVTFLFTFGKQLLGNFSGQEITNAADLSALFLLISVLISISIALIRWKPDLKIK